jgi:hypothetical protein
MTDNQTVDKLNLIIQALEKYIAFTPSFYDVGKEAVNAAYELRVDPCPVCEKARRCIKVLFEHYGVKNEQD